MWFGAGEAEAALAAVRAAASAAGVDDCEKAAEEYVRATVSPGAQEEDAVEWKVRWGEGCTVLDLRADWTVVRMISAHLQLTCDLEWHGPTWLCKEHHETRLPAFYSAPLQRA